MKTEWKEWNSDKMFIDAQKSPILVLGVMEELNMKNWKTRKATKELLFLNGEFYNEHGEKIKNFEPKFWKELPPLEIVKLAKLSPSSDPSMWTNNNEIPFGNTLVVNIDVGDNEVNTTVVTCFQSGEIVCIDSKKRGLSFINKIKAWRKIYPVEMLFLSRINPDFPILL